MAIKKNEDGTYTADFYKRDPFTNRITRIRKKGFKTKKAANEYIITSGQDVLSKTIRFDKLLDIYLDSRESRDVTKEQQRRHCEIYFPYMKREFSSISKAELINFRNTIADMDLATVTKNKIIHIVKAVFEFGSFIYECPNNAKKLNTFKSKYEEQKEMQIWEPEEFYQFIQNVDNYVYKAFFTLLYNTGMRRGEARALYKTDIIDKSVNISKSMRRAEDSMNFPKTKSSIRTIKLDDYTYTMLKPLLALPGKYLFGEDSPISNNAIQYHFAAAIKKAGVKKIRLHDLRHSHASLLINSGANIVAVSKRLGHSDINQTLTTYTHMLKKSEDDLLSILNEEVKKNGLK